MYTRNIWNIILMAVILKVKYHKIITELSQLSEQWINGVTG